MTTKLSRRKLADYAAKEIALGNKDVIRSVAAYLVQHRRVREVSLIAQDIELRLMQSGSILAQVFSARKLSGDMQKAISAYVSSSYDGADVQLQTFIDESLIGGVIIRTPDAEIDTTIKTRIENLTT